jgi:Tfp pilus assembly protein PilF
VKPVGLTNGALPSGSTAPAVFIAVLLFFFLSSQAKPAEISSASESPIASARQYKQAGDRHVAENDLDKAADAYGRALDLARESFSIDERVRMAIYLARADRLQKAKEELAMVLAAEPNNLEARAFLARVLSWNDELSQAIDEAEKVLQVAPDNREALQVKADALQWSGNLRRSIPIYEKLVQARDDFDARLGLSQALLAAGNRTAAEETSRLLQPITPNQRNRHTKFQDTLDAISRPTLNLKYLYYNDTDDNRVDRYSASQRFWLGNVDLGANFRHTEARDPTRYQQAEELSIRGYANYNDNFAAGGSLGLANLGRGRDRSTFPTGDVRLDVKIPGASIGVNLARDLLTDSAQLIENRIRMVIAGVQWSQQWTDRLSIATGYKYRTFSDVNHSHDAQLAAQYILFRDPKIAAGYRFRYLNYDRQSGGGYFDPNDYYSNRVFMSSYVERRLFYLFAEIFVGQQAFRRGGVKTQDPVYGGSASLGLKPSRNLTIEFNIEGGQLATGTTAGTGFGYLILGPRIQIRF